VKFFLSGQIKVSKRPTTPQKKEKEKESKQKSPKAGEFTF